MFICKTSLQVNRTYGNITLLESDHDILGYQVSDLILWDIRTVELASDWLIANLGTVKDIIEFCYRLRLHIVTLPLAKRTKNYPCHRSVTWVGPGRKTPNYIS